MQLRFYGIFLRQEEVIIVSFNEKLQQLRKANKLSQEQLADMLDVTRQSVSKWESGTTYPEMDKLITMCKIFKCSLDDLTNDEITEINVEKKQTNTSFISNIVNNILEITEKTVAMFKKLSAKQIAGVLASLFIIGIFLMLLRIPFEVIENGFYSIVTNIPNRRIVGGLSGLFNMIMDIVFFILYILSFIYIYKLAYLDKYDYIDEKEKTKSDSNSDEYEKENTTHEEKTREIKIVHEKSPRENTLFCFLGNIVFWFFRILTGFCIIPFIFTLVALFAIASIAIVLMFDGIFYIGILLGLIFAIILNLWLLELGCMFIFNKKANFHRLLWTLCIGLSGIGISIGLVAIEIGDINYIDEIPAEYERVFKTEEYPMSENLSIDYLSYYYNGIEYIEDETMTDRLQLSFSYYADVINPTVALVDDRLSIDIYYSHSLAYDKKIWELIKRDLRNKELRNYDVHGVSLSITTSKENIAKIKENSKEKAHAYYNGENCNYTLEVRISDYETKVEELTEENERLREEIRELEEYKKKFKIS